MTAAEAQVDIWSGSNVVTGRVREFSLRYGWGFIDPDDGGTDILLHRSVLGDLLPPTGAAVTVIVDDTPKGRRAAAVRWDQKARNTDRHLPATVDWFSKHDGYGFVTLPLGEKAFIHATVLCECGIGTLNKRDRVKVLTADMGAGKLRVTSIALASKKEIAGGR